MKWIAISFITAITALLVVVPNSNADESKFDALYERAQSFVRQTEGREFRDRIAPRWLPDGHNFWYQVRVAPNQSEYVRVDTTTGELTRAQKLDGLAIVDEPRITTSTHRSHRFNRTMRTGEPTTVRFINSMSNEVEIFWITTDGERRSYGKIPSNQTRELQTYDGHVWQLADATGGSLGTFEATWSPLEIKIDGVPMGPDAPPLTERRPRQTGKSPDGKSSIRFERHNIVLEAESGEKTTLTSDGSEQLDYRGPVVWSPNSAHCVVLAVRDTKRREVTVVNSSPSNQIQPRLMKYDYFKPGDDLPQSQPVLISVADKSVKIIPNGLFPNEFTENGDLAIRWSPSSDEFFFSYNERGHQLYRILGAKANDGAVRIVVEERSPTFIEYGEKTWHEWLDAKEGSPELLWMSERDGWAHLWLYDVTTGMVKNQVTRGKWVVRKVLHVDALKRQVLFLAGGLRDGEDPYQRHLCRVNLDGSEFVQLTEGDGDHSVEVSPDGQYFVDTWSRVDQPAVTELRRLDTGKLVCELEREDISRLLESGWSPPERFVAKGRDGVTDIYGIIIKPSNFDPAKRYPVVEEIYAGPHSNHVPKSFGRLPRQHMMAELGFVIVQIDGMGTDHRGKAFHDVSWKNLADAGFADRIAWIKAAAVTRPWMDLSRVGIYGGSAGGQNAMRALLDHHDFYHVAVADCGCHDNRMDKIWWNEQWLGWPVDDAYIRSSNVEHADRLQGKLLLIVGELDTNVDPASTMQVVRALQKAGKRFEFMPIASMGHGAAETPYGSRLRAEFLTRHLLGRE